MLLVALAVVETWYLLTSTHRISCRADAGHDGPKNTPKQDWQGPGNGGQELERDTLSAIKKSDPEFSFLAPPKTKGEIGRLGPYRVLSVLGSSIFGSSGFGSFLSHLLLLRLIGRACVDQVRSEAGLIGPFAFLRSE